MLIKQAPDFRSSEITPKSVYLRRREFIQASAAALVAAGLGTFADEAAAQGGGLAKLPNVKKSPLSTTEAPSLYDHITSYNNFYEFAPGAGDAESLKCPECGAAFTAAEARERYGRRREREPDGP